MSRYSELNASEIHVLLSMKRKDFESSMTSPKNPFSTGYSEDEYGKLKKLLGEITELIDALQAIAVAREPGEDEE